MVPPLRQGDGTFPPPSQRPRAKEEAQSIPSLVGTGEGKGGGHDYPRSTATPARPLALRAGPGATPLPAPPSAPPLGHWRAA